MIKSAAELILIMGDRSTMTKAEQEAREIVGQLKEGCYCEDCVDQEIRADGNFGSFSPCLHCTAAAALSSRDEALSAAKAEVERLRKLAKELSDALLKVRPLGGSELFRRFDDKTFYADPEYCGRAIEQLRDRQHEACKEAVRERRRAEAAEAREAEARKVIQYARRWIEHAPGSDAENCLRTIDALLSTPSPEPSKDGADETANPTKRRNGKTMTRTADPLTTPQAVKDAAEKIALDWPLWGIAYAISRIPIAPDDRDEKIRKAVEAITYYVNRLETHLAGKPVRDMGESAVAYKIALTELTGGKKP